MTTDIRKDLSKKSVNILGGNDIMTVQVSLYSIQLEKKFPRVSSNIKYALKGDTTKGGLTTF